MSKRSLTGSVMLVVSCLMLAAGVGGAVQDKEKGARPARSVTGAWTMTFSGGGAHGVQTMGLTLEQRGKSVTGTIATPHGDVPLGGEFKDDVLELATDSTGQDLPQMTLGARLLEDGTLDGYLSSAFGDMRWTATRRKERR